MVKLRLVETLIIVVSNSRGPDRQTDFRRITDSQTDRFLLNIRRTELVKLKPLIIVVYNSGGPDRQTDFRE